MVFAFGARSRAFRRSFTLATFLSVGAVACGGIAIIDDDGSGGSGGSLPIGGTCGDLALDANVPVEQCLTGSRCELRATLGGFTVIERCDAAGCTLLVDGEAVCICPTDQIDFANTCNNGIATCRAWRIDWSDVIACKDD